MLLKIVCRQIVPERNYRVAKTFCIAIPREGLAVTEFEYFRMRVAQEDKKARAVLGTEAELVHRSLAANYARRAVAALSASAVNDAQEPLDQSA